MPTETLEALRRFIETAPDAMLVVDGSGVVRLANRRACDMFRAEDLHGTPVESLMPDRFAAGHVALREQFTADPTPRVMGAGRELEARRTDGDVFPVDISLGVVDAGPDTLISVAVRDVTARRELEARAAMHEFIIASTREAIVAVDEDGVVTTWNRAAERLTGHQASDVLGRDLFAHLRVTDERLAERMRAAITGADLVEHGRTSIERADGTRTPVALSMVPMLDALRSSHGATALVRDVSEELETQQFLAEVQGRLQDTERLARIGFWIWDSRTDEVQWSEQLHEIAGVGPLDFGGDLAAFLTVIDEPSRSELDERVRAAATGEPFALECEIATPGHGRRWVEISGEVALDADGTKVGASGICQDVTERQRAIEALREADRLKDEFLGTVSHELRTPLTAILGFAQVVHDQVDEQLQSMTEVVTRNAREMHNMVERILDFSRLQSGRINLSIGDHDLSTLFGELQPLVAGALATHDFVVGDPPALTLRVDPEAFRRVLVNLLTNAAKFTPDGGRIELRAEPAGERCRISVIDEGPGIPEEHLETVFERFFQVGSNLVAAKRGAGVGLSIVRSYTEAMGGTVWAESEKGRGATFVVELPLAGG